MRLEQLEYLLTVHQAGSINKAGLILHTSPQNISKALSQLENELEISLTQRSYAGTVFTKDGLDAVVLAKNILALVQDFKYDHHAQQPMIQGIIHIVSTRMPNLCFVNTLLGTFNELYPQIKLSLNETDALNAFEVLAQNKNYIGILPCLVNKDFSTIPPGYDRLLQTFDLIDDKLVILTQKGSAISKNASIAFKALKNHKITVIADNLADAFVAQIVSHYIATDNIAFTTGNAQAFYQGIASGRFIGIASHKTYLTYGADYKSQIEMVNIREKMAFQHKLIVNKSNEFDQADILFMDYIKEQVCLFN